MATVTVAVSVFILRGFSLNLLLFSDVLMSLVVSSLRFSDPMAEYRKSSSIYIPSGFCCLIIGTIHETLGKMGENFSKTGKFGISSCFTRVCSIINFFLTVMSVKNEPNCRLCSLVVYYNDCYLNNYCSFCNN